MSHMAFMVAIGCGPMILIGSWMSVRQKQCFQQNAQIKPRRPVIDVPNVVLDPMLHQINGLRFAAKSVDLSPASNPRLYVMTESVIGDYLLIFVIMGHRMRAGTNQGHGTDNNVIQLGQFIDAGLAKPAP